METTTQATSLRQTIHDTTRALHERLDHDPLSERIMSADATLEEYKRFLARNYGFLRPMEQELHAGVDVGYQSYRSESIERDLLALGMSHEEAFGLPVLRAENPPASIGYALGMRYVIEGSAVGGLVIAKQVQKNLKLVPDLITFLLPDQPKAVMHRINAFLSWMEEAADCDLKRGQALLGANRTFKRIVDWFETSD